MPARSRMRSSSGRPSLAAANCACSAIVQVRALTGLANSAMTPSPIVLTMRPRCWSNNGSMMPLRRSFSAASVPASSRSMSLLYPTTSADRMEARRRSTSFASRRKGHGPGGTRIHEEVKRAMPPMSAEVRPLRQPSWGERMT